MRNIVHTFVSILMWILFAYYWYLVVSRQINIASARALGTLALITLLILVATVLWIVHNKKLASKNRRNQAPPPVPEWFETDHLGATLISPGLEVLREAASITINLDGAGQKVYSVTGGVGD